MRLPAPLLVLAAGAALGSAACVANSAPRANGYNVELWFAGPHVGQALTVGEAAPIEVKRVESDWSACANQSARCDPTTTMPITLVSAACDDDACSVESVPSDDGVVHLRTTGTRAGAATLRVHVMTRDGTTLEDSYPLVFEVKPVQDTQRAVVDLALRADQAYAPAR